MPKHTTTDPAKRAFHIAEGDARRRYDALSLFQHVDGHRDADYFGNTCDTFEAVMTEIGRPLAPRR